MNMKIVTDIRNKIKGIACIMSAVFVVIGAYNFIHAIEKNKIEANDRGLGYEKWKENVLNDNSPEAKKLREEIDPNNNLSEIHEVLNDIQVLGIENLKNLEAAANINSDIPPYIKKPIIETFKQTINHGKNPYYIKFVNDEGDILQDENGKDMIYRDGQKITLKIMDKPYKYIFSNSENIISFVDNSDKSKGKYFNALTIPITYTDDESVVKTLYNDITTLETGKTILNIIYGNPTIEIKETFKYHFKFDLIVNEYKSNYFGIGIFVIIILILILVRLIWKKMRIDIYFR